MRAVRVMSAAGTLTLLLGLCVTTPASSATTTRTEAETDETSATSGTSGEKAERRLRADAADPVIVRTGSDGEAEFVGTLGAPVAAPASLPVTSTPTRAAEEHLDRYGALFGVQRPDAQLDRTEVVATADGSHVVKFAQTVDGLPVIGGELAVAVDPDGDLESVNGETTDPAALPAPAVSARAAVDTAVRTTSRTHGVPVRALAAGHASRWYYDPELVGSPDPVGPRPVWRVEVTNGSDIREMVLVDSATGGVAAHVNQTTDAKVRVVCNRGQRNESETPCRRGMYARTETSRPADDPNVERAFLFAGHTWDLYQRLGRDLTRMIGHNAGDGRKLRLTANLTGDNAFWNGREAFFSRGWSLADDVVAHELSHGVVERSSGLMYWYQSGAINESMADVFGEIVDNRNGTDRSGQPNQRNWLIGEDAPGGTLRDMRVPTRVVRPGTPRQPDRMRSRFYFPDANLVDNGGVHINSGVGNKAAVLIAAGGRFNGLRVRGIDAGRTTRIKTARIYLRVLPMLTSGSDYADLGRLLPQACRRLVGRGRPAIRRADCVQVGRAVRATQMQLQPRRAQAPEAPRCTPRRARTRRLFFDRMERNRPRAWRFGPLWGHVPGVQPTQYATSGRRSVFGRDPNARGPREGSLTLRRGIRVRDGRRTFLRFEHARLFEHNFRRGPAARYFDGGRVEYSLNHGRTWHNTAGLRWVNGPHQLINRRGDRFRGFGGDSHGYMSSRLNLSRFRGRTVHLRWTVSGDQTVAFLGWWLDDIDVYTCRRRT